VKIPKVQKDTDDMTVFLLLWDLCTYIKAAHKMLVTLTQGNKKQKLAFGNVGKMNMKSRQLEKTNSKGKKE